MVNNMIYTEKNCSLKEFVSRINPKNIAELLYATDVQKNVPIYDCTTLREKMIDPNFKQALMVELQHVLSKGAGVFVFKHAFMDTTPIDKAS